MTMCVRGGLVGLALVAVLTTSACNDSAPVPPTTTTTSTTSTSSTGSPSSTTPADPRLARAEAAVASLSHLVDVLAADPKKSLDPLTTVARDQTLDTWVALLTDQRRHGYIQVGEVSIEFSGAKASAPDKVAVDACVDVSKTDLLDKAGKSIVAKDRTPRVRYAYVVQQAKDGKFYVVQDKAVGTC